MSSDSESNDEVSVQSNLYHVTLNPIHLYWFKIDLKPEVSNHELRRRIIYRFCNINRDQLDECSFSHGDILYVTQPFKSLTSLKQIVNQDGKAFQVFITEKPIKDVAEWQRNNVFNLLMYLWTKHYRRFGKTMLYEPSNVLASLSCGKLVVSGFLVDFEPKKLMLQILAKAYCCDLRGRWVPHKSLSKPDFEIYNAQVAWLSDSLFSLIVTAVGKLSASTLSNFGVELKPLTVSGRVLPPPSLLPSDPKGAFYRVPQGPIKWATFLFDQQYTEEELEKFTKLFAARARKHGLDLEDCISTRILPVHSVDQINNLFGRLHEQNAKFVLIGSPYDGKSLEFNSTFLSIKYNANKTYKLINQFFVSNELADFFHADKGPKKLDTLLIKINTKIGGQVNIIDPEYLKRSWHDPSQTMLVGAMVSFPYSNVQSKEIYSVIVGSMDSFYTKHETIVTINQGNQISQLESVLTQMLDKYHELNKHYPKSLIFFRQSSSFRKEDNPSIYKNELCIIKKIIKKLMPSSELIYIVARNTCDLRFCLKQSTPNSNSTLPNGTLVDHCLEASHENTFYLCINYGIEHASKPVVYRIYENTSSMSRDQLQQLCFDLCHYYSRKFGATRFPIALEIATTQATKARHRFEGQLVLDQANSLSKDTVQELLEGFNRFSISNPTAS